LGTNFGCSAALPLVGRRNAVANVIYLMVFANVAAIALYEIGTCVAAVKTKLDTFNEIALLRGLVLALAVVITMRFDSSRRSTAPAPPPPGPDPELGHVLGPPWAACCGLRRRLGPTSLTTRASCAR